MCFFFFCHAEPLAFCFSEQMQCNKARKNGPQPRITLSCQEGRSTYWNRRSRKQHLKYSDNWNQATAVGDYTGAAQVDSQQEPPQPSRKSSVPDGGAPGWIPPGNIPPNIQAAALIWRPVQSIGTGPPCEGGWVGGGLGTASNKRQSQTLLRASAGSAAAGARIHHRSRATARCYSTPAGKDGFPASPIGAPSPPSSPSPQELT